MRIDDYNDFYDKVIKQCIDGIMKYAEEGDYQIIIPMTYHEDEDPENTYESNFCKNLYYLGQEGIEKYDVFAYSDILYLLEKYTDTYLELGKAKLYCGIQKGHGSEEYAHR